MHMHTLIAFFKSLPRPALLVIVVILVLVLGFGYRTWNSAKSAAPATSYTTENVAKGTLIVSVTGSGTVVTANAATISTKASGVVKSVYVRDGDVVAMGDVLAEIELDRAGQESASSALAAYQSAKSTLANADAAFHTLQSDMLAQWQEHYALATNSTFQNADGSANTDTRALAEFHISEDDWLASEAKYKNQQTVRAQASAALSAAWLSYEQSSGKIIAPIAGTVTGFALQEGSVIGTSTTTNGAATSTAIARIQTKATHTISVNLTETDVPKVAIGNKATVTFDALPNKTYSGSVISIDTAGAVSSGVTTYPATIALSTATTSILPNMAASANIITAVKNNVMLVSTGAVKQADDGTMYVEIMREGKPVSQTITTGLQSDTQTEVVKGLNVGDTVVIGTANATRSTTTGTSQTQSPFGALGGGGSGTRMMR